MDVKAPSKIRARFFKDVDGKTNMVEIKIVGDPNSVIHRVKPEHLQRFPREWENYEAGSAKVQIEGTPLTDVPGIDRNAALALTLQNVRTAEELAALDEGAAKALGMGVLTWSQGARNLLKLRELEAQQDAAKPKKVGRPAKAEAEAAA